MARGGGRLIPFLMEALLRNLYPNLKYENLSLGIFYLEFPRFTKNKMSSFERILTDWYQRTGKADKYPGYSQAKAVLQAALKRSIYLVSLKTDERKIRFRLATQQVKEEKKKLLKLKTMRKEAWNENDQEFCQESPLNPPSVASSGYVSGSEEWNESVSVEQENNFRNDENLISQPVEQILYDDQLPPVLFQDEELDQFLQNLEEEELSNFNESLLMEASSNNLCDDASASRNIWQDDASPSMSFNDPVQQPLQPDTLLNQVVDLKSTTVIKKFWYPVQKIKVDDILISVCEKQIVLTENQGIQEGGVYIPDDFWEGKRRENYILVKDFQLNGKYFCFFHLKSV